MARSYSKELDVYINNTMVGIAWQDVTGACNFRYEPTYTGTPLSLSMPISNRVYGDKVVKPYLMGLVPDDVKQRRSIAGMYDIPGENCIALLNHIGYDCPGAVRFFPSGVRPNAVSSEHGTSV